MRYPVISTVTLSLLASLAYAGGDQSFGSVDADNSGTVTKDEFYGSVGDLGTYSNWDNNGDGLINEEEFSEIGVNENFADWDANNDDYLDADEFYEGTYITFDENEDGHWQDNEWDDAGDAGWLDA